MRLFRIKASAHKDTQLVKMVRPSGEETDEKVRIALAGRRALAFLFASPFAVKTASTGAASAALAILLTAGPSTAQVVLDPNFSPDTVTAGEFAAGQTTDYLIRESFGRRAGDNLFHRFSSFDIPAGQSATFVEDAPGSGIRRVISHIGGSAASRIDGVLRSTIPNADIYLLNPRGVVFGAGASLDVAGSFYTSTADHLGFADGTRFGDIASGAAVTLSAAEPTAWGFLSAAPAEIAVEGARLAVPDQQALSFVGGPIRIEGPGTPGSPNLAAPSGALHLVAVNSAGDVEVNPSRTPDLSQFERLAEIRVSEGGVIDGSGLDDHTLRIAGDSLLVDDGVIIANHLGPNAHPGVAVDLQLRSLLRFGDSAAGTTGTLISTALRQREPDGSPGFDVGDGGDVRIAAGEVRFDGPGTLVVVGNDCVDTFACADADQPGGAGGAFEIETDHFAIRNGAVVVVQTIGPGDGSDAQIRTRTASIGSDPGESAQSLLLSFNAGRFDVGSMPSEGQNARGGEITIDAEESLILENGGTIRSTTWNNGAGGDLILRVGDFEMVRSDPASIVRRSAVTAETEGSASMAASAGLGQAGGVSIISGADLIVENGFIQSSAVTSAAGGTGEIELFAETGTIELGAGALVNNQIADGMGGATTVRAKRFILRDGGTLASTLENEGTAGDVRVFAEDILVSGTNSAGGRSLIASRPLSAGDSGGGASGSIQIEGRRLRVEDGAAISVSTIQFGEVGNLQIGEITPLESVVLENASLEAEASRSIVTGGDIEIHSDRVLLDQGARITTSNTGAGDAGTIRIDGRSLQLRNNSLLETAAGAAGTGGDIDLEMGREVIIRDSAIRTDTRGATPDTQGGNIDVRTGVLILAESALGASAPVGSGGQIVISGGRFLASPTSTLDASGGVAALDGIVQILSAETNAQNAVPRPSVLIQDPTRRLATGCETRTEALGSLFISPPPVQGAPGEELGLLAPSDRTEDSVAQILATRCGDPR